MMAYKTHVTMEISNEPGIPYAEASKRLQDIESFDAIVKSYEERGYQDIEDVAEKILCSEVGAALFDSSEQAGKV